MTGFVLRHRENDKRRLRIIHQEIVGTGDRGHNFEG
jgi:hypothetical protein